MKRFMMSSAMLALFVVAAQSSHGQDDPDPFSDGNGGAKVELSARFYDVSHLIVAKPQYPFTGKIPASSDNSASATIYGGGLSGGGGLGGGGGAAGGGAGFFSVPPVAVQMGGMQGGGFGGGGFGGGGFSLGMPNPAAEAESYFMEEYTADGIAGLLIENVDPNSWDDYDGPGTLTPLGNTLLIRQTAEVHKKIGAFLKQLTAAVVGVDVYELEAWWIPGTPDERRKLNEIVQKAGRQTNWNLALNTLTEQTGGFHGRLLCRERTTTHQASGIRRPLVVGSVPIVGGSSSMAQPIVSQVNIGLTVEATIIPVADYLVSDDSDDDFVYVNLRSAITSNAGPSQQSSRTGDIDRFEIGANVLESGTQLAVGRPTLVGTLTSVGIRPLEGEDENETSLVIAITKK